MKQEELEKMLQEAVANVRDAPSKTPGVYYPIRTHLRHLLADRNSNRELSLQELRLIEQSIDPWILKKLEKYPDPRLRVLLERQRDAAKETMWSLLPTEDLQMEEKK